MFRTCIRYLLVLMTLLGLCTTAVFAMEEEEEKINEDGFQYRVCTSYTGDSQFIEITGYAGQDSAVVMPSMIEDLPVTHIADFGLDNESFSSILLPDTLVNIGSHAFSSCGRLTVIDIPDSVTSIGAAPFEDCGRLSAIHVGEGNARYFSDGQGVLYDKAQTALYQIPGALSGDYIIPDTVTLIGYGAISGCRNLSSITIPAGMTRYLQNNFINCPSLARIHVAEDNPNFSSEQGVLYNKEKTVLLIIPDGFTGAYTLPASVESFHSDFVFPESNITAFYVEQDNPHYASDDFGVLFDKEKTRLFWVPRTLGGICYCVPATVRALGSQSFYHANLEQIIFYGDAPEIMPNAFSATKLLLYYPAGNPTWSEDYFAQYSKYYEWIPYEGDYPEVFAPDFSWELLDGVLTVSGHGKMPRPGSNNLPPWYTKKDEIREVVILEGITDLCANAFSGTELTSVSLADSIKSIGKSAFRSCKLQFLKLPANLKTIGEMAFSGSSLRSITIPYGITDIGYRVFYGSGIEEIVLPNSLVTIGEQAFADCQKLAEITIPAGVTAIGPRAFAHSPFGFDDFSTLQSITFLGDAPQIAEDAFACVDATVHYPVDNSTWNADTMLRYGGNLIWAMHDLEDDMNDGVGGECGDTTSWFLADGILIISAQDESVIAPCSARPMAAQIRMPDYDDIAATPWYPYRNLVERIVIRDGVAYIGANAFFGLPNATEVFVGSDVTGIGSDSFGSCPQVSTITFYGDAPAMDDTAFAGTSAAISYPAGNDSWNETALDVFGDSATHAPYEGEPPALPEPRYNPFVDVGRGSFHYDAILWALDQSITNGITPTTFCPNTVCNRAQVVTFLWRAVGSPEPETAVNPFTDVVEGTYYYKAVLWAVEKGITTGITSTSFNPDGQCTRGQVVTFLWRAMDKPEADASIAFTDVESGKFYTDAVAWAVEKGITTGISSTTFAPDRTCTRGQIVTFLYRLYC